MLTCREMTEMCSRELDQPLAVRQKVSMTTHLMMCSGCRNYRRQLFRLREAARRYANGDAVYVDEGPQRT